MESISKSYSTR